MSTRYVLAVGLSCALIVGCTLDRSTLAAPGDGGGSMNEDAAPTDAAPTDAAPGDAGAAVDAAVDAAACTERCSGNVAITCPGDVTEDCGVGRCTTDASGAHCESLLCTPGSRACSEDGSAALLCHGDGMGQDSQPCARGCDGGVCRSESACAVTGVDSVGEGDTIMFDTCTWGDDWTLEPGDPQCAGGVANSEDRMLRLNIAVDGTYRIEVRDVDASRRVDPVVYLRSVCDDQSSQFACNDDVTSADVSARLDVMLTAGDYFLVVDGYDYAVPSTDFTCGSVALAVTRR